MLENCFPNMERGSQFILQYSDCAPQSAADAKVFAGI
jgi:hypothetical protein